jgi:hypothetical protein
MAMELSSLAGGGLAVLSAGLLSGIFVPPDTLMTAPAGVQAGRSVTITGSGFGRCVEQNSHPVVDLFTSNSQAPLATESTAAFQLPVTVPAGTAAGAFPVTAQCSSDPGQNIGSVSVAVVTLALSSGSVVPGTTITTTGSGYTPCSEVQVQLVQGTQTVSVSSPAAAPGGSFGTGLTVPAGAVPGDDYQVEAGCYPASSATTVAAAEPFAVTTPVASSSPTASSPSPSPSSSFSPSPSPSPSPTSRASSSASSAPHLGSGGGPWTPVALIGGTGAGAALLTLGAVRASALARGRRGRAWVRKHLRAVAGQTGSVSAGIQERPGPSSVSVGLEPHSDPLGHQHDEETGQ